VAGRDLISERRSEEIWISSGIKAMVRVGGRAKE